MTREPQDTSAEEPDGGNLKVRFRRGLGLGNRPGLLNNKAALFAALLVVAVGVPLAYAQTAARHPEQMLEMREKMNEMQALMERMHSTRNARERSRLMDEHMKAMTEAMAMMEDMTRDMQRRAEAATPPCAAGDAACRMDRMQDRQGSMDQRMEMMQTMMRHMMGRTEQQQSPAPSPAPSPEAENGAVDHTAHH